MNFGLKFGFLLMSMSWVLPQAMAYDVDKPKEMLASETPTQLEGVGIEENLGGIVDTNLEFINEKGETVTLASIMGNSKPTLLSIVYYDCPSLCNYHLKGVVESTNNISWQIGNEYNFVAVSMDHTEIPELAQDARESYSALYQKEIKNEGWHFLTGSKENIAALASTVGFGFKWDKTRKEYAHSSVAYVLTPEGKISRYLYGIEIDPKTMRLGLLEAAKGKVGSIIDRLVLYCYQFNPTKNKYTIASIKIMKAGAGMTLLVIAGFLLPVWFREKKGPKSLKGEL